MILLASLLAGLSACKKENAEVRQRPNLPPGVYYGEGREALTNLPPEAVLLRVNGYTFTRHDFDLEQDVYGKMLSFLKNGKMEDKGTDIRQLQALRAPQVLTTVLRRELLNQEVHRRGLKASEAAVSFRRKRLEAVLGRNSNTNKMVTVEELAKQMGGECGQYFLRNFKKEAENLELSWHIGGTNLNVSEADVTAGSNRLAKGNAFVAATNSALLARLQKALERVKGGEDFAKVGSELSMLDKREAENWGDYSAEDVDSEDYPDLAAFLRKKPAPGTVGGPFQCEDGASIVKVLSVSKGKGQDGVDGDADVMRFNLARISVEAFEMHKSLSREEIRKILEDAKRQKVEKEFGSRLFADAVIEFPSGTNLFAAAESRSQPKGDLKKEKKPRKIYKGTGGDDVK